MKNIINLLEKKFNSPLVLLFFLVGCALLLIGLTTGYKEVQIASETELRYISVTLGVVCLVISIILHYKPSNSNDVEPKPHPNSNRQNINSKEVPISDRDSLTTNDKRILRALLDEPHGRLIANYSIHYSRELDILIDKGVVMKQSDGRYKLTGPGKKTCLSYLSGYLNSIREST